MERFITLFSLAVALAAPGYAFAGGDGECHFHGNKPAAEATVKQCAGKLKDNLVSSGKIDKSWQAVAQDKMEVVEGKKGKEWKVTFKDSEAKDKSKETLYLFYTLTGNFIAANFTGK
jgi:hypothetical protein